MKIIALFVPQFHRVPLNDQYWGEGFTEWVNVRNARPAYEGHKQPRVPLNDNYYDLLDDEVKIWQKGLAQKYGIYGFCYYHYWFNGKKLLEQPCEQILMNKQIDLPFCFSWANEAWTMEWVGQKKVIMPQFYGDKTEWKEHFDYLLPFFKDERYIRHDGKPLLVLYRPEAIECLIPMLKYWRELAVINGLPGLTLANQSPEFSQDRHEGMNQFDLDIEFEPMTSNKHMYKNKFAILKRIRRAVMHFCERKFGWDLRRTGSHIIRNITKTNRISYDLAWKNILTRETYSEKTIPCAFVNWDNTPRYKERGQIYVGSTPAKFRKYLSQLIQRCKSKYHKDMMFIFAWNEWGEGGYLEPDEENGYGYLEAVRDALIENNEFPIKAEGSEEDIKLAL